MNEYLKREKIRELACQFRHFMYKLRIINRNQLRCQSLETTENQIRVFRSMRAENTGRWMAFFETSRLTALENGIVDLDRIERVARAARRIKF